MSANLPVGAEVTTQDGERQSIHVVVARRMHAESPSGVQYRLMPAVHPEWIDSAKVRKAKGFGNAVDRHSDPFEIAE
ncbi:hypothetical protein [Dyella mobilis]|uniref:Uncharacterized protein n=1 Tax=Dyella mobilis TaxID=1849582 RepID=A0ABS2KKB8_9GAMM|nr:hypothetical protein [Dyella mobilis]MBM7131581.1 hypothetical protein [Dyella mobilis]GLQ96446.1 hypothetical protein GCM10007863_08640 [Dyella mobilis]